MRLSFSPRESVSIQTTGKRRSKVIEVFPKTIDETRVRFDLQKLVGAFLSVAEDLANEEEGSESEQSAGNVTQGRQSPHPLVLPPATPLVARSQPPQP
jgi:hypothetical protein